MVKFSSLVFRYIDKLSLCTHCTVHTLFESIFLFGIICFFSSHFCSFSIEEHFFSQLKHRCACVYFDAIFSCSKCIKTSARIKMWQPQKRENQHIVKTSLITNQWTFCDSMNLCFSFFCLEYIENIDAVIGNKISKLLIKSIYT